MEEKRSFNKSLMVVSLLLLSLVAALILLFVLRPAEEWEGIILPGPQSETLSEQPQNHVSSGSFLELNTENVIRVLDSLEKPEFYHQIYSVTVHSGNTASTKQVEIWVNGSWIHSEIRDGKSVKSIFTDGNEAWIWYDLDLNPVKFQLTEKLLLEDLLGLPNFDYREKIRSAKLFDAGYATREEDLLQYVYVTVSEAEAVSFEYRFALNNGLMFSCTATEDYLVTYEVQQTGFEQLAYGDQAFDGRFCLPDGTVPFTAETRMLQP